MAPDGLPPLRDVIARHGLSARKSLGQNFLLDLNLTARIARASGSLDGATVVEVGPGPGGLTRALLFEGAAHVIAIERDDRCFPALAEVADAYPGRLTVIGADALRTNIADYTDQPYRIVANLPYNVGTALLTRWLEATPWPPRWQSLTLMFQREVAERIVALPGSKAYGRLSILAKWRSTARIAFDVRPEAFTPAPKVTSSIVHMRPIEAPEDVDPKRLSAVTRAAFSQRRKMLRQTLKSLDTDSVSLLAACGIDQTRRAETLTIDEFLVLSRALTKQLAENRS
ncbi:MAG: 16S rRNA (adenine(1518)-N(6)/adenine(1519)-N(6))-dimethyltransferase RsmA [Pseudomonadota bacterium]